MAQENGNVSDLTIEVLKSIHSELQGLRGEMKEGLADVRGEVHELRGDMHELRGEVREIRRGLEDTNSKLEQLADFTQTGFKALLARGGDCGNALRMVGPVFAALHLGILGFVVIRRVAS